MATPKDPNKTLLEEQAIIDRASPTYGLTKDQFATVYDGQTLAVDGGTVTLGVSGGTTTATFTPQE